MLILLKFLSRYLIELGGVAWDVLRGTGCGHHKYVELYEVRNSSYAAFSMN